MENLKHQGTTMDKGTQRERTSEDSFIQAALGLALHDRQGQVL